MSRHLDWFAERRKWKDLCCVVMVEATRTAKGVAGRPERDAQATQKKVPRLKQLMRRAACKDEVRTRMLKVFGELQAADARPPQEK